MQVRRVVAAGWLTGLTLAGGLLAGGTAPGDAAPPGVGVRGSIRSIDAHKSGRVTLLVVGVKEADTQVDRASVRVNTSTRILRKDGTRAVSVPVHRLTKGTRVEVRFVGPVAESYPVQATAGEILILGK